MTSGLYPWGSPALTFPWAPVGSLALEKGILRLGPPASGLHPATVRSPPAKQERPQQAEGQALPSDQHLKSVRVGAPIREWAGGSEQGYPGGRGTKRNAPAKQASCTSSSQAGRTGQERPHTKGSEQALGYRGRPRDTRSPPLPLETLHQGSSPAQTSGRTAGNSAVSGRAGETTPLSEKIHLAGETRVLSPPLAPRFVSRFFAVRFR